MGASNHTPLGFNQWIGTDKPLREDFNADNALADELLSDVPVADGTLQPNLNAELLNGNNAFEYHNFKGGKLLATGSDCNTLPIGIVWSNSLAVTNTILNKPAEASGAARIITESGNGINETVYAVQSWLSRSPVRFWRRVANAGVWGPWKETAFTESGTWTPRIEGSTVAGTNAYSQQVGTYIKTGKTVHLNGRIAMTAKDPLLSGFLLIKGLPHAVTVSYESISISGMVGITLVSGHYGVGGYTSIGNNAIQLNSLGSGVTGVQLTQAALSDNSLITFSLSYTVA